MAMRIEQKSANGIRARAEQSNAQRNGWDTATDILLLQYLHFHHPWRSKCWRKPGTKIRNLIKGGVSEPLAIRCGISSKAYWRSAKTKGIQIALNDEWLKKQGLISLRDRWISFTHHSRTAHCGSACWVVWGLREKTLSYPIYVPILSRNNVVSA